MENLPNNYISLTKLAKLTKRNVAYISRLVKEGRIAPGKKIWRSRYVLKREALLVLSEIERRYRKEKA